MVTVRWGEANDTPHWGRYVYNGLAGDMLAAMGWHSSCVCGCCDCETVRCGRARRQAWSSSSPTPTTSDKCVVCSTSPQPQRRRPTTWHRRPAHRSPWRRYPARLPAPTCRCRTDLSSRRYCYTACRIAHARYRCFRSVDKNNCQIIARKGFLTRQRSIGATSFFTATFYAWCWEIFTLCVSPTRYHTHFDLEDAAAITCANKEVIFTDVCLLTGSLKDCWSQRNSWT